MITTQLSREKYIDDILQAYRNIPGTTGIVRKADRTVASELFDRGVPLRMVENALYLAAARRLFRPENAPKLNLVRSLAYFLPVVEEVLHSDVSEEYFAHLRFKLARVHPAQS